MRRSEARRARASAFSLRLQDEIGGTYGTVTEATEVVVRLLDDPAAVTRMGRAGVVAVGEIVCSVWSLSGGDREALSAWMGTPHPALAQRSPRQCIREGDVGGLLALVQGGGVA
ncbi:DUF2384 domain-containing protein, partial [Xanthomonas sp. Kuri4-1]